jgi:PAS domain S-box-containing protein
MLNNLSEQIRNCYGRAEEARQQADATTDPALKATFLEMERRWLMLARSYGFTESLGDFTNESRRWQEQSVDGAGVSSRFVPDATLRLQEISTSLIQERELDSLYGRILEAAVDLMASDMASMQEFEPERNELRLLGWKGFHPESALFWEWVRLDSGSSCAAALSQGRRIIVPDIETSELIVGTPDADEYRRSGIRAVQSTPLISRSGRLLGMISTHWREVHQPSERALRSLDVLARQAADLIERSKAEARLRESEERARQLAAVVEASEDAIIGRDLTGTVTAWNKGAEHLFGYTADEAIGMPNRALIPPDRRHEEAANVERIRCGGRIDPYDTVRQRKDGSLVDVSLSISPIRDLSGQVIGASKILRNITERKRAEAQIAMLAGEAEHRTANLIAAVQSIVRSSHADTPEDLKEVIKGRLQALSNAQALLSRNRWGDADILNLAREELAPYLRDDRSRVTIQGPHIAVAPQAAQAIAVVLHELTTNAAKYGALAAADGHVDIILERIAEHSLLLRWIETGGPPAKPPSRQGYGTEVMQGLVKLTLRGKLSFDWREEGLACEIEINERAP